MRPEEFPVQNQVEVAPEAVDTPEPDESPSITGTYDTPQEFEGAFGSFIGSFVEGEGASSKIYDRYSYPDLKEKETEVATALNLEPGQVLLYNSGMAAISDTLFTVLRPGDTILYNPQSYFQTTARIESDFQQRGIKAVPVDFSNITAVEEAFARHSPTAVFTETVGNSKQGMGVVNIDHLIGTIAKKNEKYQVENSLEATLEKRLRRIPAFQDIDEHLEGGLEQVIELFKETAEQVDALKSYAPLRKLYRQLTQELGIELGHDQHSSILELKSILEAAWSNKRQNPITLILDNTLPTEASVDLTEKMREVDFPIVVAESGTKFFAKDAANLGITYSTDADTMLALSFERAKSGTILSPAAEKLIPPVSTETLEGAKDNLRNTRMLATTFDRLVGSFGITAVSYPNLEGQNNYEYSEEKYPTGASPLFYVKCHNAKATVEEVLNILQEQNLADTVKFSVSFGFDTTRILYESPDDTIIRIAPGKEDPEYMQAMCEALLNATK